MFRMFQTTALIGGIAAMLASHAALAGPSMATKTSPTKLTLEQCKQRAQDVAKKAQFKISKVLQYSIYAEQGDYSVIVRCAPEQGLVFFAAAGPRMERAAAYVDEVGDDF